MKDDEQLLNLVSVGLNSELAQKAVSANFTLAKLRRATKKDLESHFNKNEIEQISKTVHRKPIPKETLQRLVEECELKCCICWNYRKESPVIIHHIEEHSRTGDDSYDNLVILCLEHHALAHSKWEISRHHLPPELIRKKKTDWIEALIQYNTGKRPAPGNEQSEVDKWWERKESVYWEVIGILVTLVDLLDRWIKGLVRSHFDEGYNFSQESQKAICTDYQRICGQIRRSAIEGDYLFSINTASALSTLSKQFEQEDQLETLESMIDSLSVELKAARECLNIVRDEAKADLGV